MVGEAQQAKRRATASNETQLIVLALSQSAPFSAPDASPCCCGTEKPAKRGEVESPLRLGQRPNECDALANRASCEAHPVAHVNTRQGLPLDRAWSLMPRDYGCCGTEKRRSVGE